MKKLVIALAILFPTTAFAQTPLPKAGEAMPDDDEPVGQIKKVTEMDFEAEDVEGGTQKPLDESIEGERHIRTKTLIKTRVNFVPELLKSVEDL